MRDLRDMGVHYFNITHPDVQNRHRNIIFQKTRELMQQNLSFDDLVEMDEQLNFAPQGGYVKDLFSMNAFTRQNAYDNFALNYSDRLSDAQLHELVGMLLLKEKGKKIDNTFLRNNSLAKSFLQIEISRHNHYPAGRQRVLKDHFITKLRLKATDNIVIYQCVTLAYGTLKSNPFSIYLDYGTFVNSNPFSLLGEVADLATDELDKNPPIFLVTPLDSPQVLPTSSFLASSNLACALTAIALGILVTPALCYVCSLSLIGSFATGTSVAGAVILLDNKKIMPIQNVHSLVQATESLLNR